MAPHSAQPRRLILNLRKFDLQFPLPRRGPLRENVKDERGAVANADVTPQGLLQIPLLAGRELVVKDDRLDTKASNGGSDLGYLAGADVGAWVRVLQHLCALKCRG